MHDDRQFRRAPVDLAPAVGGRTTDRIRGDRPAVKPLAVLTLVLACGLTACGSAPVGDYPASEARFDRITTEPETRLAREGGPLAGQTGPAQARGVGASVAGIALRLKGVPYVYGGTTPAGFDCSGLVHYVYAQAGVQVPRTARAQMEAATKINPDHAQPGDLLFFHTKAGWHVAIYLGRDKFIHAPWPGIPVSTASLRDEFYRERLKAAGRLTPD